MGIAVTVITIVLFVATLIDIIRRDDAQVRYLPRIAWIVIVVLLPLLGSILWWAIGRVYDKNVTVRLPRRRPRPAPTSPAAPPISGDDRSTEEQLADLDREIEEWRLREEIARRRRERGTGTADDADDPPDSDE